MAKVKIKPASNDRFLLLLFNLSQNKSTFRGEPRLIRLTGFKVFQLSFPVQKQSKSFMLITCFELKSLLLLNMCDVF